MNRDLLSGEYKRFPKHWEVISFTKAFKDMTGGQTKIPKGDYLESGDIPIIDQGQDLIGGYTNERQAVCDIRLPCVVFGDHTKIFKFVTKPFALGADGVKVLSEANNIDPKFAYYFLNTLNLPDVGYSRHFRFLKRTFFPLPPLEEQQRIAAILDKADGVRRKRKEAIRLTEELLRSTFLEMFGDPVTNPKGWEVVKLGSLVVGQLNNGIFKKNHEYGGDTPVVWVKELFSGYTIDCSESRTLTPTDEEVKKFGLTKGDILFCRSSLNREGIGFNNVFDGMDFSALFECHIIRVSLNQRKVNSIFLNYLLRFPGLRKQIIAKANTVTMSTIGQSEIKKIEFYLPPKELQDKFEIFLRKIATNRTKLENKESENLFNSLLQRAFRGEL
ncbi:MAG: restriction endonuclease subunit S [Microcystis sp.]|jgi:type I restriction enzyme S subunit|uniref:restriction endonuclease subunit S n=1 Tax=Microcystis sp. TaxID=1127 RepID=UPI00391897BF